MVSKKTPLCVCKLGIGHLGEYQLYVHMSGVGINRVSHVSVSLLRCLQDMFREGWVECVSAESELLRYMTQERRKSPTSHRKAGSQGLEESVFSRTSGEKFWGGNLRWHLCPNQCFLQGHENLHAWRQKERHTRFCSPPQGRQRGSQIADECTHACSHMVPPLMDKSKRWLSIDNNGSPLITINHFLASEKPGWLTAGHCMGGGGSCASLSCPLQS